MDTFTEIKLLRNVEKATSYIDLILWWLDIEWLNFVRHLPQKYHLGIAIHADN